jgi:hypothetical protein
MSVIDQEIAMNFGKFPFAEIDNPWIDDFEHSLDEFTINIKDFPPYPNFLDNFGNFDSSEIFNLYFQEYEKSLVDYFY